MKIKELLKTRFYHNIYLADTGIAWLDWLSDKAQNIYTNIVVFKESTQRFFYWGWAMRKNHDWDYQYLLIMLDLKLARMEKCFKTQGHCVWNSCPEEPEYKTMRKFEFTRYVLKRLLDRDSSGYAINSHEKHDKKWGKLQWNIGRGDDTALIKSIHIWRKGTTTPELEKQEREEYRELIDLDEKIYNRDKKVFYKLLHDYGEQFWD